MLLNYFTNLEGGMIWIIVPLVLIAGLALLTYGGDWLADGAASMADFFKVEPIVIGITVVSTATSAPELLTCLIAALGGNEGDSLVLGNIVGSNLCNIALIMGLAAMVCPIVERERYVYWEIPWLLIASGIFAWFCFGDLTRNEGAILLIMMVAYMVITLKIDPFFRHFLAPFYMKIGLLKGDHDVKMVEPDDAPDDIEHRPINASLMLVIGGAIALFIGANFLVDSAQAISLKMNVNQGFVGLTVVAIGTSLPELAASIGAARKGHTAIIAGNIFGSNLFNMLFVGGITAVASPVSWDGGLKIELILMMVVTGLLLIAFQKGPGVDRHMGRSMGLFFILVYAGIMIWSGLNLDTSTP
jgi:cation:H+ antiporter